MLQAMFSNYPLLNSVLVPLTCHLPKTAAEVLYREKAAQVNLRITSWPHPGINRARLLFHDNAETYGAVPCIVGRVFVPAGRSEQIFITLPITAPENTKQAIIWTTRIIFRTA